MADISITAANVVAGSNAKTVRGRAGVAVTAGQVGYLDATSGKWALADTDSATAAVRGAHGVFLNSAALNQPVEVITEGDVTIGATIEAGTPYFLSGTPGALCPLGDVAAGDYPLIVGMGKSTTVLSVKIQFPNVVKA